MPLYVMFESAPITRRLLILWVGIWCGSAVLTMFGGGLPNVFLFDPWQLLHLHFSYLPGVLGFVFLHDPYSLFHVLGNAWMFAIFAPEIERLFPAQAFLRLLLKSTLWGVGFTLLMAWLMPQAFSNPILGASGLVATVFAASAAMYPQRSIYLFLFRVRLLPLFLVLTGLDLLGFLAECAGQERGVAYTVHLAGVLVGWLAVGGFQRFAGPWQGWGRKWAQQKEQKWINRQRQVEQELDRILAKISREGMQSLTAAERKFLQKRSQGGP